MPYISLSEWKKVILFSLATAIVTSFPFILGWSLQDSDWQFSGIIVEHFDIAGYFARMQQGYAGNWTTALLTTETHERVPFVYSYYILMGQFLNVYENITGQNVSYMDFQIVFHLFRAVIVIVYGFVTYGFVANYIKSQKWRFLALIITIFGGGFGWILVFKGEKPLEFFYLEGFSQPMMLRPHLLLARVSLFGGFLFLFRSINVKEFKYQYILGTAICWNIVTINFPLYVGTLYAVIIFWGALVWLKTRQFPYKMVVRTTFPVLSTVPLLLFLFYTFYNNPVLKTWQGWDNAASTTSFVASPSIDILLLSFGLLFLLSLVGATYLWRRPYRSPVDLLPVAWLLAVICMIYMPVQSQRRLAEGIIVILAILSVHGIRTILVFVRQNFQNFVTRQRLAKLISLTIVILLTHASILYMMTLFLSSLNKATPIYNPQREVRAVNWLNECLQGENIIVASGTTSLRMEALLYPANHTLYGHMHETIDADRKLETIENYLRGDMSASERLAFYETYRVNYILFDSELDADELDMDNTYQHLNWQQDLNLIYSEDTYHVYSVSPNPNIQSTCQVMDQNS